MFRRKTVSLSGEVDRWWDQTDLTKLILASNKLTEIGFELLPITLPYSSNIASGLKGGLISLQAPVLRNFPCSKHSIAMTTKLPASMTQSETCMSFAC